MRKSEALQQAEARDQLGDRLIWLGVSVLLGVFLVVDIVSNIADVERSGLGTKSGHIILWEVSSVVVLIGLFPALLMLTKHVPLQLQGWQRILPFYLLASIGFAIVHIASMVGIRKLLSPVLFDCSYDFVGANGRSVLDEFFYEYWKDLSTFFLFVGVILTFRHLFSLQQELEVAKTEAKKTSRLSLKCGGRSIFLDAHEVHWAKAAGNYVEIGTAAKVHLARMTLSSLQTQLEASDAPIIRAHRSWLVNTDRIIEMKPVNDGDQQAILQDGTHVPVSRRYRAEVKATSGLPVP